MGSVQYLSMNLVTQGGKWYVKKLAFINFQFLRIVVKRVIGFFYMLQKSDLGDTIGHNILQSRGLPTNDSWYWIGVGVLLGYSIVFNGFVFAALAYLNRKLKHIFWWFIFVSQRIMFSKFVKSYLGTNFS